MDLTETILLIAAAGGALAFTLPARLLPWRRKRSAPASPAVEAPRPAAEQDQDAEDDDESVEARPTPKAAASSANADMAQLLNRSLGFAKVEPRSEQRAAGREVYSIYTAFTESGFTPAQSMELIRTMIAADIQNKKGD